RPRGPGAVRHVQLAGIRRAQRQHSAEKMGGRSMTLDSNEIMKVLPHRFPFQLVDRITACEPGVRAEGRKCVSAGEPFFCGHFPELHVMPGVLILEAMAQVGAVALLTEEENKGKIVLFGGVKNARFKR